MGHKKQVVLFTLVVVQTIIILIVIVQLFLPDLSKNLLQQNTKRNGWPRVELQSMFRNNSDSNMEDKVKRNEHKSEQTISSQGLENRILLCPAPKARLGNWMFRFAASVGIAHRLKYQFAINSSHSLLEYFDIKQQVVTRQVDNVIAIKEAKWRSMDWREYETYRSHNLTLNGYYQSWKYFENESAEVRESFEIKPVFRDRAMTFLERHTPKNKTLIGIHVRRGDFLHGLEKGKTVADKSYFQKAMKFYRERYGNLFFVVVSNDMQWCKDNIKGDDVAFSEFGWMDAITDMAIMSLSDHAIITSGTFSWWCGWLCGGTVVYLKDFPRPGSQLDIGMFGGKNPKHREEYYRPEWIGMSNSES